MKYCSLPVSQLKFVVGRFPFINFVICVALIVWFKTDDDVADFGRRRRIYFDVFSASWL